MRPWRHSHTLTEDGWCDIHDWQAEEAEQSECERCAEDGTLEMLEAERITTP